MRRIGLYAVGLVLAFSIGLTYTASSRARGAREGRRHTCSVTDRQFIETAKTNVTAVGLWGDEYLSGDAAADEVVHEAKQAARIVDGTNPTDPSLRETRRLMIGMFTEYGRAVEAKARGGDPGAHMYRAYGLANFAHDVLVAADAPLRRRGCSVRPLL